MCRPGKMYGTVTALKIECDNDKISDLYKAVFRAGVGIAAICPNARNYIE